MSAVPGRHRRPRPEAVAIGALTALALALRLYGLRQSLFGDELFTYDIIDGNGLVGVVRDVRATSITPPLHYVLAWLASQVGDPATSGRIPSVLAGTAIVPLVWRLGVRTVGDRAALLGAALLAIGPFAVFYGVELRAYAVLGLLLVASALALVEALDSGRRAWWTVFVVASCAALYTHYSATFVLAAAALWALVLRPEACRAVLIANGVVLLGYAPWIPSYLHQRHNFGVEALGALYPVRWENVVHYPVQILAGHPFLAFRDLPGKPAIVLLGLGVGIALLALVVRGPGHGPRGPTTRHGLALIVAVALAQPVGEALYSLVATSIYVPRNLFGSLPALCLLLGALLTRPRPALIAAVASACALVAVAIGTITGLGDDARRPPWKQVAAFVDAAPRDVPVLVFSLFPGRDPLGREPLRRSLEIALDEPRRVKQASLQDRDLFLAAARSGTVLVVVPEVIGIPGTPPPPRLPGGLRPCRRIAWAGFAQIALYVYRAPPGGAAGRRASTSQSANRLCGR